MIEVGAVAPDFELASQIGGKTYKLSQFKGEKNVLLVFYPLDWTPNWSQELPDIEKNLAAFQATNTQVLSISVDSHFSHENWANHSLGGISFPILADFHPKGAVADSYGVYLADMGITDRATIFIVKDGIVRHASSAGIPGLRQAEDLLDICQSLGDKAGTSSETADAANDRIIFYHYNECGFCQRVKNNIKNLRIEDKFDMRNIRENEDYGNELEALCGNRTVPTIVINGKPMRESQDIIVYLMDKFAP